MNWGFAYNILYLVTLRNLADDLPRGWVDGGEGFLADRILPFIVDENLQFRRTKNCQVERGILIPYVR